MRPQKEVDNFEVPLGTYIFKRDESGAKLQLKDGKSFSITLPESRILYKLLQTPNNIVDKHALILEAWGSADIIGPNSLPVAITNLRKILKIQNIEIVNAPKKGYFIKISSYETTTNKNDLESCDSHNNENDISNTFDTSEVASDNIKKNSRNFKSPHLWSIYISIFLIFFSLYIIFYVWLSWIEDECAHFENGTVCYIKGDHPPDPLDFNGKAGDFFYSTGSGWVAVEGEVHD